MTALDSGIAQRLQSLALSHVMSEYPNKLDHVMNGPEDVRSPRELHPIFFGSFDWHSNVHAYWLLATLMRLAPDLPKQHLNTRALFQTQFTPEKIAGELAYLNQDNRGGFERPYGWAWVLMLGAELKRQGGDPLEELTRVFAERLRAYLNKLTYPIRVGTHFNTAFALALGFEYSVTYEDDETRDVVVARARECYGRDRGCQAWEPGGDDFLSSALIEAECMRRVLPNDEWVVWFDEFLPELAHGRPETLFTPAFVSDRTDGKIAHLDGLNLSRAWCWRAIASSLPSADPRRPVALKAADIHLETSLPHIAGDYAGQHWLATYALLALLAG